jgi:DNA polymerase
MDNNTRLQYLQVMGIDSWSLRQLPTLSRPAAEVPISMTAVELDQPQALKAELPVLDSLADAWQVLQQEVSQCQRCDLCKTRHRTVFGQGHQQADWLFIGEAPGEQEDLQGLPFVGPAGLLLTEMLRAIDLSREQVFIANVVKCRPPRNRDPKIEEMAACQGYLNRQIALIQPKIIVAVGRIAAHQLLQTNQTLANLRGNVYDYHHIPLLVIYHPAYLLRSLIQKRKAWQDLQLALKVYSSLNTNIL